MTFKWSEENGKFTMIDEACDVFNKDGLFKINEELKDKFDNLKRVEEKEQTQEWLQTNMHVS